MAVGQEGRSIMVKNERRRFVLGGLLTMVGSISLAVGGIAGQMIFMYNATTASWLVPVRLLCSGIIMLVIAILSRNNIFEVWKTRRDRVEIVLFGLFGAALGQYGFNMTVQYSSAAIATVLVYTAPVLMLIFLAVRYRRKPKLYEIICVILVLTGTVAMSTHFKLGAFVIAPKALAFGFLSAAGFCFYTQQPQRLFRKFNMFTVLGWGMLIGGGAVLLFCRFWKESIILNTALFWRMVVVVIFGTIIAFYFYQQGVIIVGGMIGTILSSVETVSAVVLSMIFFHTQFQPIDILGFVLIMATVPLIAVYGNKTEKM